MPLYKCDHNIALFSTLMHLLKNAPWRLFHGKAFCTPFQCVCAGRGEGFHTPPNNTSVPAGCPTIQLNSDTIYLKIASDPTD